jgi:RNA polymerase sigma-70 factor (ECF subfamily)
MDTKANLSTPLVLDVQLVQLIAQGDLQAFGELYDRYSVLVFSLSLRMVQDHGEAEDILQETFIGIWKNAGSFSESLGNLTSWIIILTRNKAIDHLRRRQRQRSILVVTPDPGFLDETSSKDDLNGSLSSDVTTHIRGLVAGLTAKERQAIELAFFDGFTYIQVAEKLGEPLGTVKARIRRGMLHLRADLVA